MLPKGLWRSEKREKFSEQKHCWSVGQWACLVVLFKRHEWCLYLNLATRPVDWSRFKLIWSTCWLWLWGQHWSCLTLQILSAYFKAPIVQRYEICIYTFYLIKDTALYWCCIMRASLICFFPDTLLANLHKGLGTCVPRSRTLSRVSQWVDMTLLQKAGLVLKTKVSSCHFNWSVQLLFIC